MADNPTDQTDSARERAMNEENRRREPDNLERDGEALWREVDRDVSRELAEPQTTPDKAADADREAPAEREPVKRDPRAFPDEISRGFYVRDDFAGDQHVYSDSKGSREVFQASENRLRTKLDDPQAVKMMLDTATHRGWASVNVKGSADFRREAWLEGQARGISVGGYRPNDLDRQELKRREQGHLRNELAPAMEREGGGRERDGAQAADERAAPANSNTPDTPERGREERGFPNYKEGIEGVLVEQGSRPYRDDPKADPSAYAVLRDAQGRQHTAWGVGIPNALMQSGAREGDMVRLRETGMETVTKSVIREVDGQSVRMEQPVNRRAWEADVTREREDLERDAAGDRETPGGSEREERINAAESNVKRMVDARDQQLHTGPGRDPALSEGAYANEARAKEYMAGGRVAAGRNPELAAAASMEAYVERKVRQKFGNDPVAVQRAMTVARNRIGQAMERGVDFPQPRVEEGRERGEAQRDMGSRSQEPREPQQEQERDRERDRQRERQPDRER